VTDAATGQPWLPAPDDGAARALAEGANTAVRREEGPGETFSWYGKGYALATDEARAWVKGATVPTPEPEPQPMPTADLTEVRALLARLRRVIAADQARDPRYHEWGGPMQAYVGLLLERALDGVQGRVRPADERALTVARDIAAQAHAGPHDWRGGAWTTSHLALMAAEIDAALGG